MGEKIGKGEKIAKKEETKNITSNFLFKIRLY